MALAIRAAALLAAALWPAAANPEAPPVPLGMTVVGQVLPLRDGDPSGGFLHEWPGIQARARFTGDAVSAAFDDSANSYRLRVDGGEATPVIRPGRRTVRLDRLGPGEHEVTLEKVGESFAGPGAFLGFLLPEGGVPLPPRPHRARQIEFVGDSDTTGFGITASTRDCAGDEIFLATDTQRTYGAEVAQHFDADFRIIARSGIGVVRNYGGAPGPGLPASYGDALADGTDAPADPGWHPQIVVVALGSNDFAVPLEAGEPWPNRRALRRDYEAGLGAFLAALRGRHPEAHLLVVRFADYGGDYARATEAAVAAFEADGGRQVGRAVFPELERTACHWHPSLADHRSMAATLIAYIDARPELWLGR